MNVIIREYYIYIKSLSVIYKMAFMLSSVYLLKGIIK